MKKFASTALALFICLAASAQDYYNVEVKTYVGSKIDDAFSFVMAAGKTERKGFEGKLLAKIYSAKGFDHYIVAEMEKIKAEEEAEAAAKLNEQKNGKRPEADIILEKIQAKRDLIRAELHKQERMASASQARVDFMNEKLEALEKIEAVDKKSPAKMKAMFEKYEEDYEKASEIRNGHKGVDYSENDVGSYCDFTLISADKKSATFSVVYAYSKFLNWTSAEGNNNGNSIVKFPIFESYFTSEPQKITIPIGAEYCIQFGRRNPKEASNLQDALKNSALFSGKDMTKPNTDLMAELNAIFKANSSPLDAHGLFADIRKKYDADTGMTVRAVIKITVFNNK